MPNIFNAQEFFENTAHIVSQGRGLFTIPILPPVLLSNILNPKIGKAYQLLRKGITAKEFSIPGQRLGTYSPYGFTGPTKKLPYAQIFDDITVDFLIMSDKEQTASAIYYLFVKWHELIAGPLKTNDVSKTVRSDSTEFGVRYYDEYTTTATAKIYTPTALNDTAAVEIDYTELYPIYVGNLNTSWASKDAPLTLKVTFAYHYSQLKG